MNSKLGILCALGGGIAIGIAVGVLIAPEKGSDTRQRLMHLAKSKKSELEEQLCSFLKSKGINLCQDEISEILENHEKHC